MNEKVAEFLKDGENRIELRNIIMNYFDDLGFEFNQEETIQILTEIHKPDEN